MSILSVFAGPGKDLLESRQLDVVHVQKLVVTLLDHSVERPRPAIQTLHRHHDRQTVPSCLDTLEEKLEARLVVRDVKFLDDPSVVCSDADAMLL